MNTERINTSNVTFHENLILLTLDDAVVSKDKGQVYIEFKDQKTITSEKISEIMNFLIKNKPSISKDEADILGVINHRLIKFAGNDTDLKNNINQAFKELLPQEIVAKSQKSSFHPDPKVRYDLGLFFEATDPELARKYYRSAAKEGLASAQLKYATMLQEGKGGKSDVNRALNYLKQAADGGLGTAQLEYVKMLESSGKKEDLVEARKYLKLAAENGSSTAQEKYALWAEAGKGGDPNYQEARKYFKLVADKDKNSLLSKERYAVLLEAGKGGDPDYKEALKYYELPAKKGSSLSQSRYGILLISGQGGHKNIEMGEKYLKKAADQGEYEAIIECLKIASIKDNVDEISKYSKKLAETPKGKKIIESVRKLQEESSVREKSHPKTQKQVQKSTKNRLTVRQFTEHFNRPHSPQEPLI